MNKNTKTCSSCIYWSDCENNAPLRPCLCNEAFQLDTTENLIKVCSSNQKQAVAIVSGTVTQKYPVHTTSEFGCIYHKTTEDESGSVTN